MGADLTNVKVSEMLLLPTTLTHTQLKTNINNNELVLYKEQNCKSISIKGKIITQLKIIIRFIFEHDGVTR